MSKVIFILLVAFAVNASATTVKNCETGADDNESVTISGCDASPCTYKRDDQVKVTVKFTTTSTVEDLTADVDYTIDGSTGPVPGLDGQSVCGNLQTTDGSSAECPLESGVTYVFADTIEVPRITPSVKGTVRANLKNGNESVSCFEVDVIISE